MPWGSSKSQIDAPKGQREEEEEGPLKLPGCAPTWLAIPGLSLPCPPLARSCHPMTGECLCLPGWEGLHCNESCPQDRHGPGCQEYCLCLHGGVCLPDSGLCQCAPGYTVGEVTGRGGEAPGWGGQLTPCPARPRASRARTVPACARPTPTDPTALRAAPATTPWPARPWTGPASARKAGARRGGGALGEGAWFRKGA